MSNLKKQIIIGTVWSVFGQIGSLLIILVTNIWLARLLSPKEFGQVGVIMFFVTLANVLTESGLGGALIRKKDATKLDYSTVFVTNLVLSIFCFMVIFFSAESIARYYDDDLLKNLLIVAGLVLIINAFQLTQNAKLFSEMRFKEKVIYRFIAVLISSVIGVYLAYQGLGVWALIIIQILTSGINTLLLWFFEGFFLRLRFSIDSFKELYAFGMNTTIASLLNTGFDNVYQLVLARYFSIAQTGYFFQAKKLQEIPGGVLNMVMQSVIFSSLAKLQDDKMAFSKVFNKIALYFLVALGFISAFLYLYAESIIIFLYGKQWLSATFYLQLLSVAGFFYLQEQVNRVIFKVFNQTKQILYLEYVKKTIQAISIVIGIYYLNLQLLIIGLVITNLVGYLINYYYSRRIIGTIKINELFMVVKVIVLSVFSVEILTFLSSLLQLNSDEKFFTIPIFIIMFLVGINLMKIVNVKMEIVKLLKLYTSVIS